MGILLSAMAGAGDAGVQSMNQNIAQLNALDLDRQRSDLAEQKAKSLATFTNQLGVDTANAQRQAQVGRIGDAQHGIIAGLLAQKYADADAAGAGQTDSLLTPEQQAVVDAAKARDTNALMGDDHIRNQAAIQTGDVDAKTAATLTSKADLQQLKTDAFLQNVEARLSASKDRTEMMGMIAQLRFSAGAGADGKLPSDAKMIEYLVKNGMEKKDATDRVMGTGAGATKDPVAMATSLASALIANGAVKVPKDAPPGTTLAGLAMDMATAQIGKAQTQFRPNGQIAPPGAPTVPNPVAAPAAPMPATKAELKSGVVYNTARGPAVWNGTAFTAAGH